MISVEVNDSIAHADLLSCVQHPARAVDFLCNG